MKTYLTALLLVITSGALYAQKMPSDYFEEGVKFAEEKDYPNALTSFQYIMNNHPGNDLYPRAVYNVGYLYYMTGQYDSSIVIFKAILNSNFNEKESSGGGIMDDPYANYRHWASELLSNIYSKKEMYDTSLYYFAISDTVYPYLHFCGNELSANRIHTGLKYAELYQKMSQYDKAIQSLLPYVFEDDLSDNSEIITELKILLKDKKNLQHDLDQAFKNIQSRTIYRKDYHYTRYYFVFMDTEIPVSGGYKNDREEFDKDEAVSDMKKSTFYKMIKSL